LFFIFEPFLLLNDLFESPSFGLFLAISFIISYFLKSICKSFRKYAKKINKNFVDYI
jgi:hypothetical protein